MPNIKPISDLRNYSELLKEVRYGERIYLTKNGHGEFALIDLKELDDLDKMIAFSKLMGKLQQAEERAAHEGWIPEEDADKILED